MTLRTNPADPRRMSQRAAAVALFSPFPGTREPRSILADSLEGVDRALFYPAVKTLLQNEDSVARGAVRKTYDHLTDSDVVTLLPDITNAIEHLAPSDEMFGDEIRLAGLDLLSRLHIREGMTLCVSILEPERWGEKNRAKGCLTYLLRYGTHAKALLPKLQEARTYLVKVKKVSADHLAEFDKEVAAIAASTSTPTLVSLKEFEGRTTAR